MNCRDFFEKYDVYHQSKDCHLWCLSSIDGKPNMERKVLAYGVGLRSEFGTQIRYAVTKTQIRYVLIVEVPERENGFIMFLNGARREVGADVALAEAFNRAEYFVEDEFEEKAFFDAI